MVAPYKTVLVAALMDSELVARAVLSLRFLLGFAGGALFLLPCQEEVKPFGIVNDAPKYTPVYVRDSTLSWKGCQLVLVFYRVNCADNFIAAYWSGWLCYNTAVGSHSWKMQQGIGRTRASVSTFLSLFKTGDISAAAIAFLSVVWKLQ